MRSSVIAFFLSAATTFTAVAHEVPDSAAGRPAVVKPAVTRPAPARPTAELITTAGAVTRDGSSGAQASPASSKMDSGDKPRRTGSAMLLAALALMSGIALRRYSARDQ